MTTQPNVLIITGYGLNCEAESKEAWSRAGAEPGLVHFNDLLDNPAQLHACQALMFIGGFSYGDHMGSGHVLAMRIRHRLQEHLNRFIQDGKIVLGVCNGFQVMTKIGLLPGMDQTYDKPQVALLQNDCGAFQDRWIRVNFEQNSPCIFTRGLESMDLPIRHGEGKFFTPNRNLLKQIEQKNLAACRYIQPETGEPVKRPPWNPNGSLNAIAGICDPSGRVFGMMPHPEAFLYEENHPDWTEKPGTRSGKQTGLQIFCNAVEYLNG